MVQPASTMFIKFKYHSHFANFCIWVGSKRRYSICNHYLSIRTEVINGIRVWKSLVLFCALGRGSSAIDTLVTYACDLHQRFLLHSDFEVPRVIIWKYVNIKDVKPAVRCDVQRRCDDGNVQRSGGGSSQPGSPCGPVNTASSPLGYGLFVRSGARGSATHALSAAARLVASLSSQRLAPRFVAFAARSLELRSLAQRALRSRSSPELHDRGRNVAFYGVRY